MRLKSVVPWLAVVAIASSAIPLILILRSPESSTHHAGAAAQLGEPIPWRVCVRVIDGDTIELGGRERVRLIGVDTPETKDPRRPVQYFGREASEFTARLVANRRVHLAYDQTRTDRYGRTLAYVYLEDGTLVNAAIIRQGFGFAYTKYPFRYMEQFRQLEREARENSRGLWAPHA